MVRNEVVWGFWTSRIDLERKFWCAMKNFFHFSPSIANEFWQKTPFFLRNFWIWGHVPRLLDTPLKKYRESSLHVREFVTASVFYPPPLKSESCSHIRSQRAIAPCRPKFKEKNAIYEKNFQHFHV
jgi:hypothetical protein